MAGWGATLVLLLHLLWLVWVIFGALVTRGRPVLTGLHIAALFWGIAVELGPWPCPLTRIEQELQRAAGVAPYGQPFLLHYVERLVYPDVPEVWLTAAGVAVCLFNLAVYAKRYAGRRSPGSSGPHQHTSSRR